MRSRTALAVLAAAILAACHSARTAPPQAQAQTPAEAGPAEWQKTLQEASRKSDAESEAWKKALRDASRKPDAEAEDWKKALPEAVGKVAAGPRLAALAPLPYVYYFSDTPAHLAENIGNAAKFIAYSKTYRLAIGKVPPEELTDDERKDMKENEKFLDEARKRLKADSQALLR